MTSNIEQIIEDLEHYITEECKPYPLSKSKIVVDGDHIGTLLSELRMKMPGEIKKFQKILQNKDAILEDAQNKADAILEDANASFRKRINDHEIVQAATADANAIIAQAQQRADQIIRAAKQEAEGLKESSLAYVDESLNNLQLLIGNAMTTIDGKMKGVLESMQKYYAIIAENKNEIAAMNQEEEPLSQQLDDTSMGI